MMIQNLKEGMTVNLTALVVEKKVAAAKNGKQYADLTLSDKTGKLKCKIWDFKDDGLVAVGVVLDVFVAVSTYNGELQGTLSTFAPSDKLATEFCKATRFNVEEMYADITETVGEFTEPLTQFVTRNILTRVHENYSKAPAATGVHNAWVGGLLEHTWSMLQLAKPIIEHYKHMYSVGLSTDKIYFGVICHDAFKTTEYDCANMAFPKTPDGILVNHIIQGAAEVYQSANYWYQKNVDSSSMTKEQFVRERNHLMHLVSSHHGQLDFGSPVVPSTLEAILLHQLDMIDSRFMHALELVEGKEGPVKGFSEKSWTQKTQFMK